MNALATGVWKEWRDHRGTIALLAGALPLLAAIAFAAIPGRWASDLTMPMVATTAGFAGFALAALAIGADLGAGEVRRGQLRFLERLPAGLATPFLAKVLFLATVLALFSFWGFGSAAFAGGLFKGTRWWPSVDAKELRAYGAFALVGASWLLVVSCALPRGSFAFPSMVLALALLGAPAFVILARNGGLRMRSGELRLVLGWLAAAGLFVAAGAFIRGWRHGGSLRARLAWGLAPALLVFAPTWAWAIAGAREFRHVDPRESNFHISPVTLGAGGRFAFVNGSHVQDVPWDWGGRVAEYDVEHALVVDLESGAWREVGEPGEKLFVKRGRVDATAPTTVVLADTGRYTGRGFALVAALDSRDAVRLPDDAFERIRPDVRLTDLAPAWWGRSIYLPDGRRVWAETTRLFMEGDDGAARQVAQEASSDSRYWYLTGHGFSNGAFAFDPQRGRAFDLRRRNFTVELIRRGSWIVQKRDASTYEPLLWDPESDELAPVPALGGGGILVLHRDGRLLVLGRVARKGDQPLPGERGQLALVDPDMGFREELPLPDELASQLTSANLLGFTPAGDRLLELTGIYTSRTWFARLDADTGELDCVGPFGDVGHCLLGTPDRDTIVFVEKQRRIIRARFDGGPAELLFPR